MIYYIKSKRKKKNNNISNIIIVVILLCSSNASLFWFWYFVCTPQNIRKPEKVWKCEGEKVWKCGSGKKKTETEKEKVMTAFKKESLTLRFIPDIYSATNIYSFCTRDTIMH